MSDSSKRFAVLIVALLPVLVLGYFTFHDDDILPSSPVVATSSSPSLVPSTTPAPVPSDMMAVPPTSSLNPLSMYTDGTFTATGSYRSPEGTDALAVTLTLNNDVVTAVSLVKQPTSRESRMWQDAFASGYEVFVVGQKLADLQLTNVSGSSLTPVGFNDALNQIRSQAKAI